MFTKMIAELQAKKLWRPLVAKDQPKMDTIM